MTSNSAATYRKTKSGEWVVFGPATVVRPGRVTVKKKDGSTKEEKITSVGKTFKVDGVSCVYGYTESKKASSPRRSSGGCKGCGGVIEDYSSSSHYCFDCF